MSLIKKISIILAGWLFLVPQTLLAQLCTGSLGDPVVDITFGSGNNPGPSIGGLTNYTYFAGDCPQDGSYTIENATQDCFVATWQNVPHDHTGDPKGYMMVINASYQPGDFFVKNVTGLCPNTTYQFAAWIMNVTDRRACSGAPIQPNVTFHIETPSGQVLKSYSTGNIVPDIRPVWNEYGFFFTTDSSSNSIVLRLTNNAPGGCGNDLLMDDITFRACGPLVAASVAGNEDSINVCTGDTSTFSLNAVVSSGYHDPVFNWELSMDSGATWQVIPGADSLVYTRTPVNVPGNYLYRMAVSERTNRYLSSCSIYSNLIDISVNPFPVPAATAMGACLGDTVFLHAEGGGQYAWTGPAGFSSALQNPLIANSSPLNTGQYVVRVTSARGCATTDSADVQLDVKPTVFAGSDTMICEGGQVQLHATGTSITAYSWHPATGLSDSNIADPVARPDSTITYWLTVSDHVCLAADSLQVQVNKNPTADAGPDKIMIAGQSTQLSGTAGGTDISYAWSPAQFIDSVNILSPVVNPPANQYYLLQVTSHVGCGVATDQVLVKVFEKLFVPNAFTPNGDGINDSWYIETLQAYPGAEVRVYNRYGQKVFDNQGKNLSWDGTYQGQLLPSGAYVYSIDLKNNTQLIKGTVFVIY